ncbi:MAG TPA: copper-binding protein [Rubrivivax sp.]|nr:copper-binding protein [Rubrivivax sp.]
MELGERRQRALDPAEVRKIDREAGNLTLMHGEINNHAMPPMTMAFKVWEAASLEALTPGDKVSSFKAVLEGGTLTASDIQVAR